MKETILIVDDEPDLIEGLKRTIQMEIPVGIKTVGNGHDALRIMEKYPVDLLLTDIRMPGMDGMDLLAEAKKLRPHVVVIIMTGYATVERAVAAIKAGAYDFIEKPLETSRLLRMIQKGLEYNRLLKENERLTVRLCEKDVLSSMVGNSPLREAANRKIKMIASTDATVLICGETGTGKDLAARAIHELSARKKGPMITVNCPALPDNLLESELFGYRKGAFTHASSDRKGLIEKARGGTLFLDEIGDLSPRLQTKLLRVLEEKKVRPLGGNQEIDVDVRIISATNRNLEEEIKKKRFREDLYFRIRVATIEMPPLRSMREDIPLLIMYFVQKAACEYDMPEKRVSDEVVNALSLEKWPGNIRELENMIKGWYAMIPDDRIELFHLRGFTREDEAFSGALKPYKDAKKIALEHFTVDYVTRLLQNTGGNITLAAETSGIKRQSLQKIIRRYKISAQNFRK